jgi:predicted DNA-binding transcriptional regulator YafY
VRRADRLIELVGHLKAGRLQTADRLAALLEVSARTIYRDIAVLQAQGLPIEGQAGVGYLLTGQVHLPPLTFDHDELEAMALGLAYVEQVGDAALASAARAARGKVDTAWTREPIGTISDRRLRAFQLTENRAPAFASKLRNALRQRREVTFRYCDASQKLSNRRARPLALTAYFGGWMLVAWCLDRDDFRLFRLDRMNELRITEIAYRDIPGQDLTGYLATRQAARP